MSGKRIGVLVMVAGLLAAGCGPERRRPEPFWLDAPGDPALGKADGTELQAVYLHRQGGLYRPGMDDPDQNEAMVFAFWSDDDETSLPAFAGGDAQWQAIVSCVAQIYRPYNIQVTDVEPDHSNYVEVVMVGAASTEAFPDVDEFRGVAANTCSGRRPAVDLVFTEHSEDRYKSAEERVRMACFTAAHEAGHSLSLEHVVDCEDPMVPAGRIYCSHEASFPDRDSQCTDLDEDGWTLHPGKCLCRKGEQNAHQILLDKLGAASSDQLEQPEQPEPEQPEPEQPEPEQPEPEQPEQPEPEPEIP